MQMNRTEAGILAGRELINSGEIIAFGKHLLSKGAEVVIVTLDVDGLIVIWSSGRKNYSEMIPAYRYGETIDPTGCGDVFSSAFSYKYLLGSDPYDSCDFAARVAGVRAVQESSSELHDLGALLREHGVIN